MASFSFWAEDVGNDYIDFQGSFSGGQADYANHRLVQLEINNKVIFIDSEESSGGNNTFYYTLRNLKEGTRYDWTATLCYYKDGLPEPTSYTDSGYTVTTKEIVPEFDCSLDSFTYHSADFIASFTGGSSDYNNYRYVRMYFDGTYQGDFQSNEYGGSESTFDFTVDNIPSNTMIHWRAVLCYKDAEGIHETEYENSGWFKTPVAPGWEVYIGTGSRWERYEAYIGTGSGWERYTVRIGDGDKWEPS